MRACGMDAWPHLCATATRSNVDDNWAYINQSPARPPVKTQICCMVLLKPPVDNHQTTGNHHADLQARADGTCASPSPVESPVEPVLATILYLIGLNPKSAAIQQCVKIKKKCCLNVASGFGN